MPEEYGVIQKDKKGRRFKKLAPYGKNPENYRCFDCNEKLELGDPYRFICLKCNKKYKYAWGSLMETE